MPDGAYVRAWNYLGGDAEGFTQLRAAGWFWSREDFCVYTSIVKYQVREPRFLAGLKSLAENPQQVKDEQEA